MSEEAAANAVISADGAYRYLLGRAWGDGGTVLWVMLNPSTADASADDPTIRRCASFSRSWGYGSLSVVNVFALRATDPQALVRHAAPVGPDNDRYIRDAVDSADLVVAAWGGSWPKRHFRRVADVGRLLSGRAHHLGLTAAGQPMHPLYRPAGTPLESWT
jgi:hypothetical protein